jgi:hypothetical protein
MQLGSGFLGGDRRKKRKDPFDEKNRKINILH